MATQENRRILLVDDDRDIHEAIKMLLSDGSNQLSQSIQELEATALNKMPASGIHEAREYIIDSAFQGEDAQKMVIQAQEKQEPYALAFMDMRMPPGWDGLKTIREIWKIAPKTIMVIVTAYSDHSWQDIMTEIGNTHHLFILKKPFEAVELQQMAYTLIKSWNLSEQLERHRLDLEKVIQERTRKIEEQHARMLEMEKKAGFEVIAGGIGHEINTLQMVINLHISHLLQLCQDGKFEPVSFSQSLQQMNDAGTKISKVTHGLIDYYRGASNARPQSVKVKQIVEDAISMCTQLFQENGVSPFHHQESGTLEVVCQPAQLTQVLVNLLNNSLYAVRGTPEKWVKIDVGESVDSIDIAVSDSGCGIPDQIIDKIFDPFFTTKDVAEGTGLGLSISKSIIAYNRGNLFLDRHSKNTRFVIQLPRWDADK